MLLRFVLWSIPVNAKIYGVVTHSEPLWNRMYSVLQQMKKMNNSAKRDYATDYLLCATMLHKNQTKNTVPETFNFWSERQSNILDSSPEFVRLEDFVRCSSDLNAAPFIPKIQKANRSPLLWLYTNWREYRLHATTTIAHAGYGYSTHTVRTSITPWFLRVHASDYFMMLKRKFPKLPIKIEYDWIYDWDSTVPSTGLYKLLCAQSTDELSKLRWCVHFDSAFTYRADLSRWKGGQPPFEQTTYRFDCLQDALSYTEQLEAASVLPEGRVNEDVNFWTEEAVKFNNIDDRETDFNNFYHMAQSILWEYALSQLSMTKARVNNAQNR